MSILFDDGSSERIDAGSDSSIANIFEGGGTIMVWTKPNVWVLDMRMLDKLEKFSFFIDAEIGTITIRRQFSGTDYEGSTTTNTIDMTDWNHIAVTYDEDSLSNEANIFFDGVGNQDNSHTAPTGTPDDDSAETMRIASRRGVSRFYDGRLEDIRMYDRILSDAEIQTIFAARGVDGIVQGLKARWLLNEKPSGDVSGVDSVKDISGNGNNGTPFNTPQYDEGILRFKRKYV